MSTLNERNGPRLRGALAYLAERGVPTSRDDMLAHVAEAFPPIEEDQTPVESDGRPRWIIAFLWRTSAWTRAGWATKDGKANWAITDEGRIALERFPTEEGLLGEAERIYHEWYVKNRPGRSRAWFVRGSSVMGADLVPVWLEEGFCSIAASQLPGIAPDWTAEDIREAAEQAYDDVPATERRGKLRDIEAFTAKMRLGDRVMTTSGNQVFVGIISGQWSYQGSDEELLEGRVTLRWSADWDNAEAPFNFGALPPSVQAKLSSNRNVIDLTAERAAIEDLIAHGPEEQPVAKGGGDSGNKGRLEHLPLPSESLAMSIFADPDWLNEVRDLLDERHQVVFYGPPGTGKTFIARKLAADLVGAQQVKLVQFHPAYTYEDFFEGYRPTQATSGGALGFELRPGPLRQLVARAREHADQSFVLIIDEINRADLAKVFGELYFLLEYRDQAVDLLYSSEDEEGFTLPPNLYLIGTMNTADRSIALVDSAMRRRFAFVPLHPDTEPTRSLLRRWSQKHELSDVAAKLLDELNHRIDDPDFRIGPSYFMTSEEQAFSTARLDRTWRSYILPLLQEHYYGRWQQVSHRFELSSLLKAVGASVSVANLGGQDGHDRGIAEGEPKEVTADVDGDQDGPELVDGHDSLGAAPE